MDSSPYIYWWFFALLGHALLSSMEMIFISTDKLYYMVSKSEEGWLHRIINRVYKQPRKFLSTLAFGNLAILVLFSYLSLILFHPIIDSYLVVEPIFNTIITTFAIFLMLTLTGEVLPRIVVARNPDFWIKLLIIPAYILHILLLPFILFFDKVSLSLLSLFGMKFRHSDINLINRSDIDNYLRKGLEEISDSSDIDSEVKILRNALEFSAMRVRDCMVPRADIVAISEDATKDTLKELFVETGISRILVYKHDLDNIIGYIHVWEMFNESNLWQQRIAELSFVPESMQATDLMNELMLQHRSIAVVFDEFGGTSGVVTIEDLVEEIFGEIDDEYDDQSKFVKKYNDNEYVLSGRVEIDTLNEEFGLNVPESDQYSTIAGLLLHHTQRFPKLYETIIIDNLEFKIQKVTTRKIEVVKMQIHNQ